MGAVVVHGQEFDTSPGIMLPQQHRLVVDELATLCVDNFSPEVFVLQEVQEVQACGVLEKSRVIRLFPVEQIFQVVYK